MDRIAARADLGPAGQTHAPEPKAAVAPPAAPAKPAAAASTADELPKTDAAPAATSEPDPALVSMGLKQLRTAYESTKREKDALRKQLEEAKSKPVEDPEKPKLVESLEKTRQELEAAKKEMEFVAYERSEEYKAKYEQPFVEAWSNARAKMNEFDVALPDGSTRPGVDADFDAVVNQLTNRDARVMAKQMFPEDWQQVLTMRDNVLDKNRVKVQALEAKRKEGESVVKQRQEQAVQGQKKLVDELSKAWTRHTEEAHAKHPEYFKPAQIDPANPDETLVKANELLEQGFEQARDAFSIMDPLRGDLTPSQREAAIKKHTVMFNKMAAFDRLAYQLVQAQKALKDATEKLKGYEGSEPGAGDGGPAKATESPASDRMGRLMKRAT